MSSELFEFDSVTRITVGAIGQPGQRTFFLQAAQEERLINLKMEKEQVHALARGIDAILNELEQREVHRVLATDEPGDDELALEEPTEVAFAVGQMGIAYDAKNAQILLIIQEVSREEAAEGETRASARLWATLGQMRALSRHAKEIVAKGRAICPLCQQPMDPDGHFCPRGNGHSKKVLQD
jgi:uncharacterized repeat protein (TIGR03847 family)